MITIKKVNKNVEVNIGEGDNPVFGGHLFNIVHLDGFYLLVDVINNKTRKIFKTLDELLEYLENEFSDKVQVFE